MNCSAKCATPGAHKTFGECVRAKDLRLSEKKGDYQRGHDWFQGVKEYREARAQGIQPKSSNLAHVREAVAVSQAYDKPAEMI
jgi:hypothetical protein